MSDLTVRLVGRQFVCGVAKPERMGAGSHRGPGEDERVRYCLETFHRAD